ncbi:MAG: hypothetical protein QXU32_09760 [Nitrososphaerales archaeon]
MVDGKRSARQGAEHVRDPRKQIDQPSLCCMYQRKRLGDEALVKLITIHEYVHIEELSIVSYKWKGIKK